MKHLETDPKYRSWELDRPVIHARPISQPAAAAFPPSVVLVF